MSVNLSDTNTESPPIEDIRNQMRYIEDNAHTQNYICQIEALNLSKMLESQKEELVNLTRITLDEFNHIAALPQLRKQFRSLSHDSSEEEHNSQKRNTTLQKRNTTLQKRNASLQKRNTTLQKRNTTLQKRNTTLQKRRHEHAWREFHRNFHTAIATAKRHCHFPKQPSDHLKSIYR